jgi:hypothetical protein
MGISGLPFHATTMAALVTAHVHVVTIREVRRSLVVAPGHVVHQIGRNLSTRQHKVHLTHRIGGRDATDRRYGHVMHTTWAGRRQ